MSDPSRDPFASPDSPQPSGWPAGSDAPLTDRPSAPAGGWSVPRAWGWLVLLLAAGGLLSSFMLWQKLGNIQEELARRSADAGGQAIEARTLARQAQDGTRELAARFAMLETRLSEVSLQRTQLEELMQSL